MQLYEIVKVLRQRLGFTQKDVASAVGLSQQAIALLENGKRKMDMQLFLDIVNTIDPTSKTIMELLTKETDNKIIQNSLFMKNSKFQSKTERVINLFNDLNEKGQEKALEQLDMLTKIPEYRKDDK